MPDEGKGIISGTAGLNAERLFAGTRAAFQNSAAPPNKRNSTGVECPVCKEQGVLQNPVWSDQGGLSCNAGHRYTDTDDLMSRPHGTVPVAMPQANQEAYVTVSFQIPGSTLATLQSRFNGDAKKMNATLSALVQHMSEPNMLIIGEADLRRMGDAAGQPIRTAAELYGIIKGQQTQLNDLKEAAETAGPAPQAGGTALRRGEMILWFDPPTTTSLIEKANNAGKRVEEFLEEHVGNANENNWF